MDAINLTKVAAPRPIPRRLGDALDFQTHWRFLIFQQHLQEILAARHESTAVDAALAAEPDKWIKELIKHHFGRRSVLAQSFQYGQCWQNSIRGKIMAETIAALLIAGCSSDEIAEHVGTERFSIVVFEKLFFDVRPYLSRTLWIALVAYLPEETTMFDASSSRRLISAFERGWPGLAATFSAPKRESTSGRISIEQFILGWWNRQVDFVKSLEHAGIQPTRQELEVVAQLQAVVRDIAPFVQQLEYPKATQWPTETELAIRRMTPERRRKLGDLIARIKAS